MKVIHVQTVVNTIFGILDDEGNVVQKIPVSNIELPALNQAAFAQLYQHLVQQRTDLIHKLEDQTKVE